jgi:hypothetical protein
VSPVLFLRIHAIFGTHFNDDQRLILVSGERLRRAREVGSGHVLRL